MPNHIMNKVSVSDKFEEIAKKIKSKDSAFDFNKIIPMPEVLKNCTSPARILSGKEYEKVMAEYEKEKADKERYSSHPITPEQSEEYLKKYGANEWYSWALKNWGTKWNAYEVITEYDAFEFQTAWSTPVPVIAKLSKMFPSVVFEVQYADEDLGGGNAGTYEIKNGEILDESEGDFDFACEVWGFDPEEERADREMD